MKSNGKKLISMVVALVLVCGMLTACRTGGNAKTVDSEDAKVLHSQLSTDPGTADIHKMADYVGIPLNIYDRLVEMETTGPGQSKVVPGLAESWDISEEGLTYTFHLRKNVKFHNGEIFKADDVLYTFDRILDPETKSLGSGFVDMIAGAEDRLNGKSDVVSGIKVVDDNTVQITLAKPYAPFIPNLATPNCSIYNRKATTEAGDKFGIEPEKTIGTGPFRLKSWELNKRIVMEANPDYFRGPAKINEVVLEVIPDVETTRMMFETGKLDMFDLDDARSQIPYFKQNEKWKNQISGAPRVGIYYIAINENIKPFDNVRVRKALQMAIDRKSLLEKLFYNEGQLVNGIMPPGLIGYNPDLETIPYDPAKAKELLKEAGYPDGFDMEIAQPVDTGSNLRMSEALQSMLAEVGIRVTIKQLDDSSFFATRKAGELPCFQSVWSADFNDPNNFLYTFFAEKNVKGRSLNYNSPEVFKKLEEAKSMTDPEARIKLYQELEKTIVIDDAAWVPLFELNHLFVTQPYVKGFKVAWNGWGLSNISFYGIEIEK